MPKGDYWKRKTPEELAEVRRKMSDSAKGHVVSPETKRKMRATCAAKPKARARARAALVKKLFRLNPLQSG